MSYKKVKFLYLECLWFRIFSKDMSENKAEKKLEEVIYMYKKLKAKLLYYCREDNGGSDEDNFFSLVDRITKENEIDKLINEKENIDSWKDTKYWKSIIDDIDYDELECDVLGKEDKVDYDFSMYDDIKIFDDE